VASTTIPETLSARARRGDAPLRFAYAIEPVVAAIALVALAPVIALVAIIIAALSRRSPLVRHARVGFAGEPLRMLKFRTMWDRRTPAGPLFTIEEVADYVPELKTVPDARVTSRFAAWCRRYSVDELPQLVHVLCGEMSLVGPRPITRAEFDKYYGPGASEVLSLRPGLVGLWQVMGRNHLTYARRRRLDLLLARHACYKLYARILLRAFGKVLKGSGAY
jgi:exopolysaccharide production protein ExoY